MGWKSLASVLTSALILHSKQSALSLVPSPAADGDCPLLESGFRQPGHWDSLPNSECSRAAEIKRWKAPSLAGGPQSAEPNKGHAITL